VHAITKVTRDGAMSRVKLRTLLVRLRNWRLFFAQLADGSEAGVLCDLDGRCVWNVAGVELQRAMQPAK